MKRAVALRYDGTSAPDHARSVEQSVERADEPPVVVCAGEGELALRIEREARERGVPVVRDVPLCDALTELRVGEPIPEPLYEAVAAILRELIA